MVHEVITRALSLATVKLHDDRHPLQNQTPFLMNVSSSGGAGGTSLDAGSERW
jgi:hypothetical protein